MKMVSLGLPTAFRPMLHYAPSLGVRELLSPNSKTVPDASLTDVTEAFVVFSTQAVVARFWEFWVDADRGNADASDF